MLLTKYFLNIDWGAYEPEVGDMFTIFDAGSVAGNYYLLATIRGKTEVLRFVKH